MRTSPDSLRPRDLGVDVARGAALLSMYVAHVAPTGGPAEVLNLSEFLTAALFAVLVGCGAQLTTGREPARRSLAAGIVRGPALVVVGLLVAGWGAQVVVILGHLGALTALMVLLVRLPSRGLLALAVLGMAVSPLLLAPADRSGSGLVVFVAGGGSYRLTALLPWALLGALTMRSRKGLGWDGSARARGVVVLAGLGLGCGAMLVAKRSGALFLWPYSGTHAELVFDSLLALGVLGASLLLVSVTGRRPGVRLLARMGSMTLSLYVVHIAVLALWVGPLGHATDDSWLVLALLVAISALLALLWPGGSRGPLEALIDAAVRRASIRP